MEQAKRSLTFEITEATMWPIGKRPNCIGRGPFDGVVYIIKHPICPETDLVALKGQFESAWRDRNSD